MKTIVVPIFDGRISSRLDCTETFQIIKFKGEQILTVEQIKVFAPNQIDKLNQILLLQPDLIICNGLTDFFKEELVKREIQLIPWICGQVDEVIEHYLKGNLAVQENQEANLLKTV